MSEWVDEFIEFVELRVKKEEEWRREKGEGRRKDKKNCSQQKDKEEQDFR